MEAGHTPKDKNTDPKRDSSSNKDSVLGPEWSFSYEDDPGLDQEKAILEVLSNTKHPRMDSKEAQFYTDDRRSLTFSK